VDNTEAGDALEVDLSRGKVKNVSRNKTFAARPYPAFMSGLITDGGLVEFTRKRLAAKRV